MDYIEQNEELHWCWIRMIQHNKNIAEDNGTETVLCLVHYITIYDCIKLAHVNGNLTY